MYNERIVALLKRHKPIGARGVRHLQKQRTGIGSVQLPQRKHDAKIKKALFEDVEWL